MSYRNRIVALVSGILFLPAVGSSMWLTSIRTGQLELEQPIMTAQIALFSLVWSWVIFRWLARPLKVAVWWSLGGLIVGFICLDLYSAFENYHSCLDFKRNYHPIVPFQCPSVLANFHDGFNWSLSSAGPVLLAFASGIAAALAIAMRSERITARPVPA
ncbi:MAG TPA: hypothetical protein VMQ45_11540 [Burkholderiaceae bacterium]|nr:hypothetical protein [Burkholderiaceae bacterium]